MSCLFVSFSHFVKESPEVIRNKICDYLATNPKILDEIDAETVIGWENNDKLCSYVERMRKSYTWGGSIEVVAFCHIYNLNVDVLNIRNKENKTIQFIHKKENPTITITWNGGHYEPMR